MQHKQPETFKNKSIIFAVTATKILAETNKAELNFQAKKNKKEKNQKKNLSNLKAIF